MTTLVLWQFFSVLLSIVNLYQKVINCAESNIYMNFKQNCYCICHDLNEEMAFFSGYEFAT